EANSAAGAAWQTSYIISAINNLDIYVFNQAAGNSTPFAWGYSNVFSAYPGKGIVAWDWNPICADHMHPNGDFGNSIALCPTGKYSAATFLEGRPRIDLSKIPVSTGNVIKITHEYSYRALENQAWDIFALEQAFYIDRLVAKQSKLKAYLGIYNKVYEIFLGEPDLSVPTEIVYEAEIIKNKSYKIRKDLNYVVFVWNISGKDIGVAIDMPKKPPYEFGGAHLNIERTVYGRDPNNYSNGNISWHTWLFNRNGVITSFSKDDISSYSLDYYVGTPAQLNELGYRTTVQNKKKQSGYNK
ncbi:MAG: hypothetical protein DRI44_07745, partial [Chlamydiae bacterium]